MIGVDENDAAGRERVQGMGADEPCGTISPAVAHEWRRLCAERQPAQREGERYRPYAKAAVGKGDDCGDARSDAGVECDCEVRDEVRDIRIPHCIACNV